MWAEENSHFISFFRSPQVDAHVILRWDVKSRIRYNSVWDKLPGGQATRVWLDSPPACPHLSNIYLPTKYKYITLGTWKFMSWGVTI